MPRILENRFIEEFKGKEYFTREELFDFYQCFEPELSEGTLGWRIYDLKQKNIIRPLKRGLYIISKKPEYKPEVSAHLLKIAHELTEKFTEVQFCIWETAWLNEFTQHLTSKSILFIEIEKGFEESLFYELKDSIHKEVFLNPDENTINLYIAESNQPVIIKNLLTRAPLSKRTEKKLKFHTPALEKILVDLFAEERLFYFLQGSDLISIFENAFTRYSINFTRLFSYAKRRKREQAIKQFISNHISHPAKAMVND